MYSMIAHDFSLGKQIDAVSGEEYRKCQRCGAVMFENNDPWFNLACTNAIEDRESIRQRLKGHA